VRKAEEAAYRELAGLLREIGLEAREVGRALAERHVAA
jgi:hypothetical protein